MRICGSGTAKAGVFVLAMAMFLPLQGRSQTGQSVGSVTAPRGTEAVEPSSRDAARDLYQLEPGEDPNNRLIVPFLKHMGDDQKQFWSSPARFSLKDLKWGLPIVGIGSGLIAGDAWLSKQVPDKPNQLSRSLNISNYSAYALIGADGGAYLLGHLTRNDHMSESGLLGAEAAINSTAITYLLKGTTQRQRPLEGSGNGNFFDGGASFVSEHSAIAWSIASVFAHEYPGPLSQIAAYGIASAVSMTRVTAKQHFPSDVVIGGLIGWYFGRQVYRAHHDPQLGGSPWGNFNLLGESGAGGTRFMGSPSVPVDSWVYPAFERLAALGYLNSAYFGIRPWTRLECARLVDEASDRLNADEAVADGGEATHLYNALAEEFRDTTASIGGRVNLGGSLESIYTRFTGISGRPLRDSYHFSQTIVNDYGRPYAEGFNNIIGASTYAYAGPFALYVRGEYQRAPGIPSDSSGVLQAIASADFTTPVSNAIPAANRFRLIDAVVSLKLGNIQFSFGKQSEWLALSHLGPLLMSNNAEPIVMLRVESVAPFDIPILSRILGPARTDFMIGRLDGHLFDFDPPDLIGPGFRPQPYIHENKVSFHPTSNLEFGMGVTAIFAGPGLPFTWSNFLKTFYSHKGSIAAGNPAKRFSELDISYRVPGLRKWLTVYTDTLVGDEYSPLGSTRPLLNPGLYMPQVPGMPKLQLRFEGINEPWEGGATNEFAPGFPYFDLRYRSGYTNNGNMIGTWFGRAGLGGQAWATYSFSARNRLEFSFRHQEVNPKFLQGGRTNDGSIVGEFLLGPRVAINGTVQYERWNFPLLSRGPQSNLSVSLQVTCFPELRFRK